MTSIEQRDVQSVLAGIDDLLPRIAKRAQAAEDLRRLPDDTVAELDEVGFFKLLQPEQWGGLQCDPTVFYEAVRRIAQRVRIHRLGQLDHRRAQLAPRAVRPAGPGRGVGRRPDRAGVVVVRADGRGHVVDGGYLVSGAWQWSSGCDHATWAFLGGPVIKDGKPVDFGSFLIPRSEYRIDDVWHVVGLKGTGSNTVVVKDVFVPRHRFLSYKSMNDRTAGGWQNNTAPVYKMPWGTMHPTTITAPIMGMAYGAYDAHVEHQGKRVRAAFAGEKSKDDPFAKIRIAEAASDIDAGWRQLIGNVGDEYALLKAGQEIPFELRARARRDQVRATARAIASIDLLFEASGATALNIDQPVQRFWRDAHAGRVHAANEPERAYLIFGNDEFGLPPQDTMV